MKISGLFATFILVIFIHGITHAQDKSSSEYWEGVHDELHNKIEETFNEPPEKSTVEEYVRWIRIKGKDRRAVEEAWQELNVLYNSNPGNEVYEYWMDKFYYLNLLAEGSGNSTVNGAALFLLRHECTGYSPTIVWRVREKGRPVYTAAVEEGFDPYHLMERAQCLLNCAIGLLESDGRYGFSLYRDREMEFGYLDDEGFLNIPDYNFMVKCERRGAFTRLTEGEPDKELTYAFENAGEIMDECDWWSFTGERQDAEDLLVEYYKDALCKKPPNPEGVGHKFYRELAEERNLNEAINYNNGFYGVLYGKVEVEEEGVKKRAPGARVVFESIDEKWETTADENGEYRFEKVIMHKHCSPFDIWAEYQGDRVDDEFRGELEEPDPNAIRVHNLLIKSTKDYEWHGRMTYECSWNFTCKYHTGRQIEKNYFLEQNADIKLAFERIEFPPMSPMAMMRNMETSGNMYVRLDDNMEEIGEDYHRIQRINAAGSVAPTLSILIQRKTEKDPAEMKARLEKLAETDPNALMEEIKAMSSSNDNEDENNIVLAVNILAPPDMDATKTVILNTKDKNSHDTWDISFNPKPMAMNITGTYRTNKDGTADITASYEETIYENNGQPASFGCPPVSVKLKCELMLFKRRAN